MPVVQPKIQLVMGCNSLTRLFLALPSLPGEQDCLIQCMQGGKDGKYSINVHALGVFTWRIFCKNDNHISPGSKRYQTRGSLALSWWPRQLGLPTVQKPQ